MISYKIIWQVLFIPDGKFYLDTFLHSILKMILILMKINKSLNLIDPSEFAYIMIMIIKVLILYSWFCYIHFYIRCWAFTFFCSIVRTPIQWTLIMSWSSLFIFVNIGPIDLTYFVYGIWCISWWLLKFVNMWVSYNLFMMCMYIMITR